MVECVGTLLTSFNGDGGLMDVCLGTDGTVTTSESEMDIFYDLDTVWFIIASAFVFFMHLGFTMLEVGAVRPRNVENILFKNLTNVCISAIVWYFCGWPLAYGIPDDHQRFIGGSDVAISDTSAFRDFFFQWAFAATAATIVSGSVAERITLHGYFLYSIIVTGFIYPVVVYWVWSGEGFLSYGQQYGIIDFAGSGVVHMVGGLCGLVAAALLGKRSSSDAHSVPFQVFGTLILWFGWYGFNCGSTLGAQGLMHIAERVACTTTLAGASAGLTVMILNVMFMKTWDPVKMCNGILAGLVSITAPCAVVGTGSAIAIGGIGGCVYYAASWILPVKFGIDDPLEASSVHGFGGMWGILATALFADEDLIGIAYGDPTSFDLRLRNQIIGILCIAVWTLTLSFILFYGIHITIGLRVDDATEKSGLDAVEHTGKSWLFPGSNPTESEHKPKTGDCTDGVEQNVQMGVMKSGNSTNDALRNDATGV